MNGHLTNSPNRTHWDVLIEAEGQNRANALGNIAWGSQTTSRQDVTLDVSILD
jgi:hypothetical protein